MKKLYPLLSLSLLSSLMLSTGCNPMLADRWMNRELREALDGDFLLGMTAMEHPGYINWDYEDACTTPTAKMDEIGRTVFKRSISDTTFLSRRTLREAGTRVRKHVEVDSGIKYTIDSALANMRQEMYYTHQKQSLTYSNGRTIDYTVADGHLSQEAFGIEETKDERQQTVHRTELIASGSINNSRTLTKFTSHGITGDFNIIQLVRAKKYSDGIIVGMSISRDIFSQYLVDQYDVVNTGVFAINTATGELAYATNTVNIKTFGTLPDAYVAIEEKEAIWSKLRAEIKVEQMCSQSADRDQSFKVLKDKIEYFEMYETWMSAAYEKRRIEDTNAAYVKTITSQLKDLEDLKSSDWKDNISKMF